MKALRFFIGVLSRLPCISFCCLLCFEFKILGDTFLGAKVIEVVVGGGGGGGAVTAELIFAVQALGEVCFWEDFYWT